FENAVMLMTRKTDSELTREEKHAHLDAELDAEEAARKRAITMSSVSTITSGSYSKKFSGSS
ncbi:MAG: hypothetical protein IJU91_02055, partial [Selenomonadaceae bacterium]|nr:hypothetical protein [Selenomonadaceae bacterium]